MKIKAINNEKKKYFHFFFLFGRVRTCAMTDFVPALFFAFVWRSRPLSYLGLMI